MKYIWLAVGVLLPLTSFGDVPIKNPADTIFKLGSGLTGNAAQIAKMINGPVEESWKRSKQYSEQLKLENDQADACRKKTIDSVRGSNEYRKLSAEASILKQKLDDARAAFDNKTAIDVGSQYNTDRLKLQKMEDDAVKNDSVATKHKAYAAEYDRKLSDANKALRHAAEWRSRLISALRVTYSLEWPIKADDDFFVGDAKIADANDKDLMEIETQALEESGEVEKNAGGDGINRVSYFIHHVTLLVPKRDYPHGADGLAHINCVFKADQSGNEFIPAHVDVDCSIALLFADIDNIRDVAPAYLAAVEADVKKQMEKEHAKK